jgi:hypothetical protein
LSLSNSPARQASADSAPHPVAGFQLWILGLKMTVEDDRDNSPLEEQVFWCNSSSTTLYRLFLINGKHPAKVTKGLPY